MGGSDLVPVDEQLNGALRNGLSIWAFLARSLAKAADPVVAALEDRPDADPLVVGLRHSAEELQAIVAGAHRGLRDHPDGEVAALLETAMVLGRASQRHMDLLHEAWREAA